MSFWKVHRTTKLIETQKNEVDKDLVSNLSTRVRTTILFYSATDMHMPGWKLWRYVCSKCGNHSDTESHISEPLNKVLGRLIFNLLGLQSVVTATSESWSKNQANKRTSRSLKVLIDPGSSFINQSKASPLREATKSLVMWSSLEVMFLVWDRT